MKFCSANEGKDFTILGVPYDSSSSYRTGSRFAPQSIRSASYNLEDLEFSSQKDLSEVGIDDLGDIFEFGCTYEMAREVLQHKLSEMDGVPVILGGDHSITPIAVEQLKKKFENLKVVIFDAHLDYRDEYMGNKNSHACGSRRVSEMIGAENIAIIGARSTSKSQFESGLQGLNFISSYDIHETGIKLVDELKTEYPLYLSIDMDCLDPSYAPGVSNPEFFGLSPWDLKYFIDKYAKNCIAMDIVELCPPYDNGNTAILAARLINEFIAYHTV